MSHRRAGNDRQHEEQVVLAETKLHRLPERNHQIENRVEKHWDTEQKTAHHKRHRSKPLAADFQRRADDPVGGSTVEQAFSHNRCHRDEDADFHRRIAKPLGDFRSDRLAADSDRRVERTSMDHADLCVLLGDGLNSSIDDFLVRVFRRVARDWDRHFALNGCLWSILVSRQQANFCQIRQRRVRASGFRPADNDVCVSVGRLKLLLNRPQFSLKLKREAPAICLDAFHFDGIFADEVILGGGSRSQQRDGERPEREREECVQPQCEDPANDHSDADTDDANRPGSVHQGSSE